ncbi:ANTAR domain-containing protein [Actinopolymorpha singaporensis]|uniref:GAF domain-containing protein n=1 Tax=Actinopolymorpha singaporensis TaxID=117157 RepID=A0A1H1TII6_9ACTN|nr:GAF and ANTAR domain-containing protein [Actinopolymorpha singaporensis]SDS60004.1 GAF domain-containing protein [Actinopolymorpha singaporensis]
MSLTQASEGERLARTFAELAQNLWAEDSEESTLALVVKAAVDCVPGATAAGITMRHARGRVDTPVATADYIYAVDEAQYRLDEGPCVASVRSGEVQLANDLANDERWPRFGPEALRLGVAAMLSFRLFARDDTFGALNLYADRAHAFTDRSEVIGRIFASHAGVAIAATRQADHLREALETRATIGEALGILMERHHVTSDAAFTLLRQASQQRNVKLRDVAREVIYTGETPDG